MAKGHRVVTIGDPHFPYEHRELGDRVIDTYKEFNCDTITCTGDDVDLGNLSQYPSNPDAKATNDELIETSSKWHKLVNRFKKALSYDKPIRVCLGNHNDRHGTGSQYPSRLLRSIKSAYKFPKEIMYYKHFKIDGVNYIHGTQLSGVHAFTHAIYGMQGNVVFNHLHNDAGIRYVHAMSGKLMWSMNTGCMIDKLAPVFKYDKRNRTQPVLGLGVVVYAEPTLRVFEF